MVLDESLRADTVTLAGFMAPAHELTVLAKKWRRLKSSTFKIDPALELKHNIAEDHPSRKPLDETGWTQAKRVPEMLSLIGSCELTLLADTQVDYRPGRASPGDFYVDNLAWCLRRFANQIDGMDYPTGPHWVLVDKPPSPEDFEGRDVSDRIREQYRGATMAAFDLYEEKFWNVETFPGGSTAASLEAYGFAPTLTTAHAKTSDILQIADVVAGCVNEFVTYNLRGADSWGTLPSIGYQDKNMALIADRFRRTDDQVHRRGFDVFPRDHPSTGDLIAWTEKLARGES